VANQPNAWPASVVVVIPVYRPAPTPDEAVAFARCLEILGRHPIVLVAPEGLALGAYTTGRIVGVERFAPGYFAGIAGYNRLLLDPRFYERFLSSDVEVARYFVGTDWAHQHAFLRNGLAMLLLHVHGSATATQSLHRIGASHGVGGLGVRDHLYERWREALVATVRECDPHCTPAVEAAWQRVLHDGIAVIRRAAGLT